VIGVEVVRALKSDFERYWQAPSTSVGEESLDIDQSNLFRILKNEDQSVFLRFNRFLLKVFAGFNFV
jgi:hypothetical protein